MGPFRTSRPGTNTRVVSRSARTESGSILQSPHQKMDARLRSLPALPMRRSKQRCALGEPIKIAVHGLIGAVFAQFMGHFAYQAHRRKHRIMSDADTRYPQLE